MIAIWLTAVALAADHRSHVDQARFFAQRAWYADAEAELERAVTMPDGAIDPEAWYLLAMVRRQLADRPGAKEAADRALLHARDPDQAAAARALLDWLEGRFGTLRLEGERGRRVVLELRGALLDPELERWFQRVAEHARHLSVLPAELHLPAGAYAVDGVPVEIRPGELRSVPLAPTADDRLELHLRTGVSALFGSAARRILPSPWVGLGLDVALGGPWRVGLQGDVGAQVWQAPTSALHAAPPAWSAGARIGVDVLAAPPLALRTTAGWRVARIGGLPLVCEGDDPCRVGKGEEADAHGVALAHLPFAELAVRAVPRRGVGGAVRVGAEYALGAPPTALTDTGSVSVEGGWRAVGLRVGVDLSYAP